MNRKFRNRLFTFHTWLGLHLSIFFAFLFLTGSILVFGNEIQALTRPAIWTTAAQEDRTASFGTIYKGIKDAHPHSTVQTITKRPAPWFVDRAEGRTGWGEQVVFWTDPATGALVETTGYPGFQKILRELHVKLLSGQSIVYKAVAATSIILLFQIVSGLITYRRFWKGFLRWPTTANGLRPWAGGMHRLTALWATPLQLISGVTAFIFLLGDFGIDGHRPKPQPAAARETVLPAGFTPELIDRAEARARTGLQGFEPTGVTLPGKTTESFRFVGYLPSMPHIRGLSTVAVDPTTLEITGAFTPNDNTSLARWRNVVDELHYGFWGGAFSRVLWLVMGLIATGVAVTGAVIFAARLAPEAAQYGPLRRIWRGLGIFRWGYLLLVPAVVAAGLYNFGPGAHRTSRVAPADGVPPVARLILRDPLRAGKPLEVELRVRDPALRIARVEVNGQTPEVTGPQTADGPAKARFRLNPEQQANDIIAHLAKEDGSETVVTFHLGPPIW